MNRYSWRACGCEAGFSFVELLVSIIIAAIAFAAIVPMFVGAQQKNTADLFRQAALNAAQDRIEKARSLDYKSITEDNLRSTSYAGGIFGPTAHITQGGGARTLDVTYVVSDKPSSTNSQYKVLKVSVSWTGRPRPVKTVILQTIVYRQYAGPSIATFWTDPSIGEGGVLGDLTLTTVKVSAIPTQPWLGTSTASVQFTIYDSGGNLIKTQVVYNPGIAANPVNPSGCGFTTSTNAFWWSWDSTGAVDGTYSVTATAAGTTYQGPTERFYFKIERGQTTGVPTGLVIVPGQTTASLTWTTVSTATSYRVYRGTSATGPWTLVASPTVALYTDTGLTPNTTYWYTVASVNSGGVESGKCPAVSTTTLASAETDPPSVPTWGTITADVAAPGVMELTWNPSTDAGSGMLDYRIWRSNDGSSGWTVISTWTDLTTLRYADTVGSGVTRHYRITARDVNLNESVPSTSVSATTAVPVSLWQLTVTNTNTGTSKNRYVWVQGVGNSLYYSQAGATTTSAPVAGVLVPSKNGTAAFSNMPNGSYNIWVSNSSGFSGAEVETSVTINNGAAGVDID